MQSSPSVERAGDILESLGADPTFVLWAAMYADLGEAWEACPRGDWLLSLAALVGVPRRVLVQAACDCARLAQRYQRPDEVAPARAIDDAAGWAEGSRTSADCWASAFRTTSFARSIEASDARASHAAMAAAAAAFACDGEADDRYYGTRAHAAEAALHAAAAYEGSSIDAHQICADYVRAHVQTEALLSRIRPALKASEPPPPLDDDATEGAWFTAESAVRERPRYL